MSTYTALTWATRKANVHDATTLFFTFAFPLVFLVIFGLTVQGGPVSDTGHGYVDLSAPGVLSWGLASAALFGGSFTLMQWRDDSLRRLIRLSVAQSVLFVGVALLPAYGMDLDTRSALALPAMVLAVTAFLGLGLIIGSRAHTPEAVVAIANCVLVPMAFLSGSFYPTDLLPDWLQVLSQALPLRYVKDAVAYALAGDGSALRYGVSLAVLTAFSALFFAIGARAHRLEILILGRNTRRPG